MQVQFINGRSVNKISLIGYLIVNKVQSGLYHFNLDQRAVMHMCGIALALIAAPKQIRDEKREQLKDKEIFFLFQTCCLCSANLEYLTEYCALRIVQELCQRTTCLAIQHSPQLS